MSDAIEDGGQRRPVPGISGVLAFELINDAIDFVHGVVYSNSSAAGSSTSSLTRTRNRTASDPSTIR